MEKTAPTASDAVSSKKNKSSPLPDFCVVGIGASAGGMEPICQFFDAMPETDGIAFIVIQHLYPLQQNMTAEIIASHTTMTVKNATQGIQLSPNHVYIIPAETYAEIKGNKILLKHKARSQRASMTIDQLFHSMGESLDEHAIAIILSGAGSDGSLGLKSIVNNGGLVLVQSPETAAFQSMPNNALSTGLVSHALKIDEMPKVILDYTNHPYVTRQLTNIAPSGTNGTIEEILECLQKRQGYNFFGYKKNTLVRRIQRRMSLHALNAWSDYAELIKHDANEVSALFHDLLIGVTGFFRDPEAWRQLREKIIRPLVAEIAADQPLRIWVPGCSTGEEAYSLAMLFMEELREQDRHCPLQVFATDANRDAVRSGRQGIYPLGIAANVPENLLERYFVRSSEDHHFVVSKALRESLVFGEHNLLSDPPFGRLDLICCRNLLIYLESEIQEKIINLFRFALHSNGYLFLGSAESLGHAESHFTALSKKWRLYQYSASPSAQVINLSFDNFKPVAGRKTPETIEKTSRLQQLEIIFQQSLPDSFTPAAVLINESFQTLYFRGPTDKYLRRPQGTPTHDILSMVREGLRSHLRGALHQAKQDKKRIDVTSRFSDGGAEQTVIMSVIPTGMTFDGENVLLLVIADAPSVSCQLSGNPDDAPLIRQMEEEIRVTRLDLHATIERLERSNEELNISNEEVISVNEELQSINEEMESAKEELHSLNEELSLVNQQLLQRVEELESLNTDQKNLLASSDIATICLDMNLQIRWFTPCLRKLCDIMDSDIGRPITVFSSSHLGNTLEQDAQQVIDSVTNVQRELQLANGAWYLRRMLPYRNTQGAVIGVIVTYTDITKSRLDTESIAAAQRKMAETLEERVADRTNQLRSLWAELTLAEERERRILTQDLHDDLGQVLAITKIKLGSLDKNERRGKLKPALAEIEQLVDQANRSLRSLMQQMSPPLLHTLGLVPALEWLSEEMERVYGLAVKFDDDGEPKSLDEAGRNTLFRGIRELLINVSKHAGVNLVEVSCRREKNRLLVTVTDHGRGFDYKAICNKGLSEGNFGLMQVRERIEFLGGKISVTSAPGEGTVVTLEAPMATKDIKGK